MKITLPEPWNLCLVTLGLLSLAFCQSCEIDREAGSEETIFVFSNPIHDPYEQVNMLKYEFRRRGREPDTLEFNIYLRDRVFTEIEYDLIETQITEFHADGNILLRQLIMVDPDNLESHLLAFEIGEYWHRQTLFPSAFTAKEAKQQYRFTAITGTYFQYTTDSGMVLIRNDELQIKRIQ